MFGNKIGRNKFGNTHILVDLFEIFTDLADIYNATIRLYLHKVLG